VAAHEDSRIASVEENPCAVATSFWIPLTCESIPKRRTPTRSLLFQLLAIALAISLSSICAQSQPQNQLQEPVPLVNPEQRLAEWWIVTFTDEAWSFSTMVAAKFAFEVIEGVTKDLGLKSDSREANKVAWFVLSRVGDFKIYEVYQKAGFGREAATQFVRSVLENPSPYEVSKQ
jgi:hypothetical protein